MKYARSFRIMGWRTCSRVCAVKFEFSRLAAFVGLVSVLALLVAGADVKDGKSQKPAAKVQLVDLNAGDDKATATSTARSSLRSHRFCPENYSCAYDHECEKRCPDGFANFGQTACFRLASSRTECDKAGGRLPVIESERSQVFKAYAAVLTTEFSDTGVSHSGSDDQGRKKRQVDFPVEALISSPNDNLLDPHSAPRCFTFEKEPGAAGNTSSPFIRPCNPIKMPNYVLCQIGHYETPCDAEGTKCCHQLKQPLVTKTRPKKETRSGVTESILNCPGFGKEARKVLARDNFTCIGECSAIRFAVTNSSVTTSVAEDAIRQSGLSRLREVSKKTCLRLVVIKRSNQEKALLAATRKLFDAAGTRDSGEPMRIAIGDHYNFGEQGSRDGDTCSFLSMDPTTRDVVVKQGDRAQEEFKHFLIEVYCCEANEENANPHDTSNDEGSQRYQERTKPSRGPERDAAAAQLRHPGRHQQENHNYQQPGIFAGLQYDGRGAKVAGSYRPRPMQKQDMLYSTTIREPPRGDRKFRCGIRNRGGRFAREDTVGGSEHDSEDDEAVGKTSKEVRSFVYNKVVHKTPSKKKSEKYYKNNSRKSKTATKYPKKVYYDEHGYDRSVSTSVGFMEYPWQVAVVLLETEAGGNRGVFLCSAAVIWRDASSLFALVPAHCVRTLSNDQLSRTVVVSGLIDLEKLQETFQYPTAYFVKGMQVHPAWSQEDVAILVLGLHAYTLKLPALVIGSVSSYSRYDETSEYKLQSPNYKMKHNHGFSSGSMEKCPYANEHKDSDIFKKKRDAQDSRITRPVPAYQDMSYAVPAPSVCLPPAARRYSPNSIWRRCYIVGWTVGNTYRKTLMQAAVKLVHPRHCSQKANRDKDDRSYYEEYDQHLCVKYLKGPKGAVCIDDPGAVLICQPKVAKYKQYPPGSKKADDDYEYRRRRSSDFLMMEGDIETEFLQDSLEESDIESGSAESVEISLNVAQPPLSVDHGILGGLHDSTTLEPFSFTLENHRMEERTAPLPAEDLFQQGVHSMGPGLGSNLDPQSENDPLQARIPNSAETIRHRRQPIEGVLPVKITKPAKEHVDSPDIRHMPEVATDPSDGSVLNVITGETTKPDEVELAAETTSSPTDEQDVRGVAPGESDSSLPNVITKDPYAPSQSSSPSLISASLPHVESMAQTMKLFGSLPTMVKARQGPLKPNSPRSQHPIFTRPSRFPEAPTFIAGPRQNVHPIQARHNLLFPLAMQTPDAQLSFSLNAAQIGSPLPLLAHTIHNQPSESADNGAANSKMADLLKQHAASQADKTSQDTKVHEIRENDLGSAKDASSDDNDETAMVGMSHLGAHGLPGMGIGSLLGHGTLGQADGDLLGRGALGQVDGDGSESEEETKTKLYKKYKPYQGNEKLEPGQFYVVGIRSRPTYARARAGYSCGQGSRYYSTALPFTSISENMGFVHGVTRIGFRVVRASTVIPKRHPLYALVKAVVDSRP